MFGGNARGNVLRADHQAWHAQCLPTLMALQADFTASERRLSGLAGVQGVENHALLRIERRHLHHFTVLHESNGDIVVEINGPGRLRGYQRRLKAGLRKYQHLGIDVHTQLLQQARQIPEAAGFEIEPGFARVDTVVQALDGLVGGRFEILDGLVFIRNISRVFQSVGDCHCHTRQHYKNGTG